MIIGNWRKHILMKKETNCSGCYSKSNCVFLTGILSMYMCKDDVCPCGTCIIKMMCSNNRPCEDYNEFWRIIYRRRLVDRYDVELANKIAGEEI